MDEKRKALLEAIKKDNLKEFVSLTEQDRSLLYLRFGRFPLLSLCYLYGSESIAEKAEPSLLGFSNYTYEDEDFDSYLKFREAAKRSLRLFPPDRVVHPLEMLAVTNQAWKLSSVYSSTQKSYKTAETIRMVYKVTHGQEIEIGLDSISVKNNRTGKKELIFFIAAFVMAFVLLCLSTGAFWGFKEAFGGGDAPYKVRSAKQFLLAAENNSDIILVKDIDFSDRAGLDSFKGTIEGNGKTITAETNAFIKELEGKIFNLNVVIKPKNTHITEHTGLFVTVNKGEINNVKVSVKSDFTTEYEASENDTGLFFSTMVYENKGTMTDCEANIVTHIKGDSGFDTCFGALAAVNSSTMTGCRTGEESIITSETADIAGIVSKNSANGTMFGCINNASVAQVTGNKGWLPNTSGIAMQNYGKITECVNYGGILSRSDYQAANNKEMLDVYAGGIASINHSRIQNCVNRGVVEGHATSFNVYSGGIAAVNNKNAIIFGSVNYGGILSRSDYDAADGAESVVVYAGGISGLNSSSIQNCFNRGKVEGQSVSCNVYSGGIATVNSHGAIITSSANYGTIKVDSQNEKALMGGGGIAAWCEGNLEKSYSIAEMEGSEKAHFGGIAAIAVESASTNSIYLAKDNITYGIAIILVLRYDIFQDIYYWEMYLSNNEYGTTRANTVEEIQNSAIYRG